MERSRDRDAAHQSHRTLAQTTKERFDNQPARDTGLSSDHAQARRESRARNAHERKFSRESLAEVRQSGMDGHQPKQHATTEIRQGARRRTAHLPVAVAGDSAGDSFVDESKRRGALAIRGDRQRGIRGITGRAAILGLRVERVLLQTSLPESESGKIENSSNVRGRTRQRRECLSSSRFRHFLDLHLARFGCCFFCAFREAAPIISEFLRIGIEPFHLFHQQWFQFAPKLST